MSIENKMDTLWHIYAMKYYTIIKINVTAMQKHTMKDETLSERSQIEQYFMNDFIYIKFKYRQK